MLGALAYYLFVPVLYGLSVLPNWVLYGVARGVYGVVYTWIGYRRALVRKNLRSAFPEKSEEERQAIEQACYRHLSHLLVETVKNLTIGPVGVRRTVHLVNPEVVESLFAGGRSVVLMLGHYGNWEAGANAVARGLSKPFYGIYHAVANKRVDRLIQRTRARHGMRLVEMRDVMRHFVATQHEVNVTAFIADQSGAPESSYWATFLNQDSAFMQGGEKLARRYAQAVVYVQVQPIARGRYELSFDLITPDASTTEPGWVLNAYIQRLEATIRRAPQYWLWTHNRWKHARPQPKTEPIR